MKLKQSISNLPYTTEQLSPVLEEIQKKENGFKVPEGYFDSLSPRIADRITQQKGTSIFDTWITRFRKPVVWAPALTAVIVMLLLIFVVPTINKPAEPIADEWTDMNMAYDASYAEEAILAEGHQIDNELEGTEINYFEPGTISMQDQLSREEISKYLKDHEMESELLTEY